jgi:hypothetical protein
MRQAGHRCIGKKLNALCLGKHGNYSTRNLPKSLEKRMRIGVVIATAGRPGIVVHAVASLPALIDICRGRIDPERVSQI